MTGITNVILHTSLTLETYALDMGANAEEVSGNESVCFVKGHVAQHFISS
jgi:hypothetical protein